MMFNDCFSLTQT